MKTFMKLLLFGVLSWPALACGDLYTDVFDNLGILIFVPPALNDLEPATDSGSILLAQPTLATDGHLDTTIAVYCGIDGAITVSGHEVTGAYTRGVYDTAAGGFLFAGLDMNTTYRIVAVARNALGYSVKQVVQKPYNPIALGVYGQVNLTSNVPGAGLTGLTTPTGVVACTGGVYVVDYGNDRVLFYEGSSTTAMRVYGDGGGSPTATSLSNPLGVAVDAGGVYVVDSGYHRVLYYAGSSTTASRVYGQGDENTADRFVTGAINKGGRSKTSLCAPMGVAVGASGIYVADSQNNRVLHYPGTSTVADRVYGQGGDFTTKTEGLGTTGLKYPYGVAIDEGGVYIADSQNNRVLHYWGARTTATGVYGQGGNFTTQLINNGGISATSLYAPYRVSIFNGRVYIADHGNSRVLRY